MTTLIREDLASSPWVGEGHRKVWARLRSKDVRTSLRRTLRLMREAELLAPHRNKRVLGPYVHDGSIIPDKPNVMWGTDATCTLTLEDGQVTVFAAIDHCTAECVGIHAAKPGTRFEALEPLHQGVKARFGAIGRDVTKSLKIRHDHGSQYTSDAFQDQMESNPSFVRAPEGQRLHRTLLPLPLGATALAEGLQERRGASGRAARVGRAVQRELVDRAARLRHAHPGPA